MDMDGVLVNEKIAIPGADRFVRGLRERNPASASWMIQRLGTRQVPRTRWYGRGHAWSQSVTFPAPPGALLLTPGAGSDRNHPSLVAIEAAVAPMPVARVDFPYRRAGRKGPDRAPRMVACVVEEAAALASGDGVSPQRVVVGGRSMGGRMCSMAVARGLTACGLVLIAYPLHPPGRAERVRSEHFPDVEIPCLFVSGTRDPFATSQELEAASAQIAGPVTHVWIEGAGHDLKGADSRVAAAVAAWLAEGPT